MGAKLSQLVAFVVTRRGSSRGRVVEIREREEDAVSKCRSCGHER